MAHSYIYAKNSKTDRSVGIPDGVLRAFMILFIEISKNDPDPNPNKNEIRNQYYMQVIHLYIGSMDLGLEELITASELKNWYLSIVSRIELQLVNFGNAIDHNYLNRFPNIDDSFGHPLDVVWIKSLINDIKWVLNIEGFVPSGQFTVFEENLLGKEIKRDDK